MYVCLFLLLLWIYPCVCLLKTVNTSSCLLRSSYNSIPWHIVLERTSLPLCPYHWWDMDPHSLSVPRGSRQCHSGPRVQLTISSMCGAQARAHRWRRAISRHDQRASAEQLSGGSPRTQSPFHQPRCVSRLQCPPRGSKPWTVRARSGFPPPAPQLRVSWLLTAGLRWGPYRLGNRSGGRLAPLLSPSSPLVLPSPPLSHVPTSSPEWAPVSQSSRERDSVPESSQEWALNPEGSPESPETHK